MKTHLPSERGQAIVLIVLSILGLIGITALAVDGGMNYADRRRAQNAADSAVLAAALAMARGGNFENAALSRAQEGGYENDGMKSEVQVHTPPISGPYAGNSEYLQVVITSRRKTYFGSVIGIRELTNTVEAVARAKPPEWRPIMNGYAVISLAPKSDCSRFISFWAHGESTLELYGGGVFINSQHPTCAFIQQGGAGLVFGDPKPFSIVGGASIQKLQLIKRLVARPESTTGRTRSQRLPSIPFLPATGASPVGYPPPFVMPKVGCGSRVAHVDLEDDTLMHPGNWGEDFPPPSVKKLKSGVYCIRGDVRVTDDLEGTGVVLVVGKGSAHFSAEANIQLKAPRGGPLKGLLLYMPMDNHNVLVLNGSARSIFRGTILAPGARVRIVGNESPHGYNSQIIGYYIELDGNSNIIIRYSDELNYDALISPEIQFGQ